MRRWIKPVVAASAALAASMFVVGLTPVLDVVERATWDLRARALSKPGDSRIVLVLLDQASLDWGEEEPRHWAWPWPREISALALEHLAASGVRATVLDILVSEPSAYGREDDEALAHAARGYLRNSTMAAAAMPSLSPVGLTGWPDAAIYLPGKASHIDERVPLVKRVTWPIDELLGTASVLGHVYAVPDADQVFRRVHPIVHVDDRPLPLLGISPVAGNASVDERGFHADDGMSAPLDAGGRMLLNYRHGRRAVDGPTEWLPYRAYSMAALVESALAARAGRSGTLSRSLFEDAIVLIGYSAPGLLDLRATPIGTALPGVVIHATALDNLLNGDAFYEPGAAQRALYTFALALVVGLAIALTRRGAVASWTIVLGSLVPTLAGVYAYSVNVALPIAAPQIAVWATCGAMLLFAYSTVGRQRRFLRDAFGRYLAKDVIDQLIRDPESLELGGERRRLTIFFSDLEGFSGIAERLDPHELVEVLNDYLSLMSAEVLAEGGTIDKYEGDAIIAFWGAPLEYPDHAARAVRAALRCQQVLDQHRAWFEERIECPFNMRIGLHTGPVVVGNMGSKERFDYTVLGDAANLASRLEGANKAFKSRILMSDDTWQSARRHDASLRARPLGRLRVYGRSANTTVFEPVPADKADNLHVFERAFDLGSEGQWLEARAWYAKVEDDPCADACITTIDTQLVGTDEWDGTWELRSK